MVCMHRWVLPRGRLFPCGVHYDLLSQKKLFLIKIKGSTECDCAKSKFWEVWVEMKQKRKESWNNGAMCCMWDAFLWIKTSRRDQVQSAWEVSYTLKLRKYLQAWMWSDVFTKKLSTKFKSFGASVFLSQQVNICSLCGFAWSCCLK